MQGAGIIIIRAPSQGIDSLCFNTSRHHQGSINSWAFGVKAYNDTDVSGTLRHF